MCADFSGVVRWEDSGAAERRPRLVASLVILMVLGSPWASSADAGAAGTVQEIRAAARLDVAIEEAYPLPLAALWNAGWTAQGYTPELQFTMIREGHHLLPTFYLPTPAGEGKNAGYYAAIDDARTLGLPITLKSTQWESLLLGDAESVLNTRECLSGLGLVPAKCLSPFGPMAAWTATGARWGGTAMLRELQRRYPDPPLVVFLSNNEAPRLPWTGLGADPRSRPNPSTGDEGARRVAAAAWADRDRALQSGFRGAFTSPAWSSRAIFVGYGAFGPGFVGRWPGWVGRSLAVPGQMAPEAGGWDGASVPYYVNIGDPSSDHTVWGPQVAAMNWVPMLSEVKRRDSSFWFEISTWDGALPGDSRDKPAQYRSRGQSTTAARYRGMVQFGMWLLRPRVVREYRGYLERSSETREFFEQVVDAVDLVHSRPALRRFWRRGLLVANKQHLHPYAAALPPWLARTDRWFLLDTTIDPPRPWKLDTQLQVFAIALVIGERGARKWLVYAHAPLGDREGVGIQLPDYGPIRLTARVGGTFAVVDEARSLVTELQPAAAAEGS